MGASFSLQYFDEILGERSSVFFDLIKTLVGTVDDYLEEYQRALNAADPDQLAFVRHKYVTLVENLDIHELRILHEATKSASADFWSDPRLRSEHMANVRTVALEVKSGLVQVLQGL